MCGNRIGGAVARPNTITQFNSIQFKWSLYFMCYMFLGFFVCLCMSLYFICYMSVDVFLYVFVCLVYIDVC
jgi:hypothetical protein